MKKTAILLLLAMFALPVAAQRRSEKKSGARIEFRSSEHNFGQISERGKKVAHSFEFANTGTSPLVITRASVTCKCIDITFSKKPVPPGEKAVITITYNPRKQEGVFYKVIQVFTNTPEERHMVTVRGEVVATEPEN